MARNYFPLYQFFTTAAAVLNSGTINTYITGTTTNKATYNASSGGSTHANPIQLASTGIPETGAAIWLDTDQEYTFVIKDSSGNTIVTLDNVRGIPESDILLNTSLSDPGADRILFWDDSESGTNFLTLGTGLSISTTTLSADGEALINDITFSDVAATTSDKLLLTDASDSDNVKVEAISDILALIDDNVLLYPAKDGLVLSQDADTDHDIQISVGNWCDSTRAVNMSLSSVLTKQIDAGWAAGDDAGGLASGVVLANSTWYDVFLIKHTDGTVDAGFDSVGSSAANLLADSGYTYYRRLGSVLTDGSANITAFTAYGVNGDLFLWDDIVQDEAQNDPGTSAVTQALTVPTGVSVEAKFAFSLFDTSAAADTYAVVNTTAQTDTAASVSNFTVAYNGDAGGDKQVSTMVDLPTDTSAQIRYRVSASDTDVTTYINTYGWKELWD